MPFKPFEQIDSLNLLIRIRGREASHEDREDWFSPLQIARGKDAAAEGEDVGDAGFGVEVDVLLVGERDEALAWEHGGAEVDYCDLEEEEGLRWSVSNGQMDMARLLRLHVRRRRERAATDFVLPVACLAPGTLGTSGSTH